MTGCPDLPCSTEFSAPLCWLPFLCSFMFVLAAAQHTCIAPADHTVYECPAAQPFYQVTTWRQHDVTYTVWVAIGNYCKATFLSFNYFPPLSHWEIIESLGTAEVGYRKDILCPSTKDAKEDEDAVKYRTNMPSFMTYLISWYGTIFAKKLGKCFTVRLNSSPYVSPLSFPVDITWP